MKKVCTAQLTAGMLSQIFTIKSFIAKDDAYYFISTIKGTQAYWKKIFYEVSAMVKKLGPQHWSGLISIFSRLNGEEIYDESTNAMEFFERCTYFNLNPVLLDFHFQYRVEIFFKFIHGPLGKVKYHTLRVEF